MSSATKRAQTIISMAELSGFRTFSSANLTHWDVHCGLSALKGLPVPPHPFPWGWGIEHTYPEPSELDQAAEHGFPSDQIHLLPTAPWSEPELEDPLRDSNAWLTEQIGLLLVTDLPEPESQFVATQENRMAERVALPNHKRGVHDEKVRLENLIAISAPIGLACFQLDVDPNGLFSTPEDAFSMINAMPIQRVWQGLHDVGHKSNNRNWSRRRSDEFDFLYASIALQLCDMVFVDAGTHQLVSELPAEWIQGEVATSLRQLLKF